MAALTSALLRLYPRAWRERYGPEMRDLLVAQKPTLRTVADLVAGAIDARMNPQLTPPDRSDLEKGADKVASLFRCSTEGISASDQRRSAAWLVGGSTVMAVLAVWLKYQIGANSFSQALLYAAFPASLMLSSECTYFKRYSGAARTVMSVGGAIGMVLMMWASVAIGNRI